ncbi:AAA ATPase-like protein [Cohnella sp. SGD-V74]|uniref:ATP-binding protein n=1 Tax=unclassified Cohnella TaxID=2636738 RepID=UPI000D4912D0|nr:MULTISPECIES: ATP-binding protein [unclassified Cohnella]PRX71669.1 AAA ATPase-like protein [Cohnella sp. SGD-V74]
MRIGELLNQAQRSTFIGRKTELEALDRLQEADHRSWKILNLHGLSGIGKTTVLRMFAERTSIGRCLYVPGHDGHPSPAAFVQCLLRELEPADRVLFEQGERSQADLIQELNGSLMRRAEEAGGIVVLLDEFEQWVGIEGWIREEWIPSLSPSVKLCIVTRNALGAEWSKGGWNRLIDRLEMKPFTTAEVRGFAEKHGLTEPESVRVLYRLSGGIPLSLSIACDRMLKQAVHGAEISLFDGETPNGLPLEWLGELLIEPYYELLEAACVVWRFDQEILEAIVRRPLSVPVFREFCNLPFVAWHRDHWRIHDLVRKWGVDDLQRRKPGQYAEYRARALQVVQRRESGDTLRSSEWTFDKLALHEDEFIRQLCFQWDGETVIRECAFSDMERAERLYHSFHRRFYRADSSEDRHAAELLRPLWEADPSSFVGMWRDGRMVAFCAVIPLHSKTVAVLKRSPITAPLASRCEEEQVRYAIPFAGMDTDVEYEISGILARSLLILLNLQARIVNLLAESHWMPYLRLMGYERAAWADGAAGDGTIYRAYQIDLRDDSLSARIDRLLSGLSRSDADRELPSGARVPTSPEETVRLLKPILKRFDRLPYEPALGAELSGWYEAAVHSGEGAGLALRQDLLREIERMETEREEEAVYGKILKLAYVRKVGTHETIAERLNLSVPTYYRYLSVATRKLALRMWQLKNGSGP